MNMYTKIQVVFDAAEPEKLAGRRQHRLGERDHPGQLHRDARPGRQRVLR
jgi:hypothetical protein